MKFLAVLALFFSGVVGLAWWLASPAQVAGAGHGQGREDGDRPAPSAFTPSPGSATAESEPAPFLRRGKYPLENGVRTERSFLGEIRDWARTNPEAALAWAQEQPDGDEARQEALTDVCFRIAETDPKRAVMLAEQFKLSRDAVLQNLARQWAAKDLRSASQWIAEQTDDDQRNALVTGVTFVWSQTAPAEAAGFVAEQMTPGSARDAAVMMVIHQWARVDSGAATTWISRFPAGPLRDRALEELASLAPP